MGCPSEYLDRIACQCEATLIQDEGNIESFDELTCTYSKVGVRFHMIVLIACDALLVNV